MSGQQKIEGQHPQLSDNYSGDLILGPHNWVIANGYYKTLSTNFNPLGDISILDGGGLTIDDNVTLYMNDNKKIEAQGKSGYLELGENALITKVSGGTYWSGLDINHGGRLFTSGDIIVEYAICGIDIQDSSSFYNYENKITIRNCTQAGLWVANGSPTINNFYFDNVSNSTYQNGAITVTGTTAHPVISRVTIENTYFGMRVSSTYPCTSVQNSVISSSNSSHSFQINTGGRINLNGHNNICPISGKKAINNAASDAIDAKHNYWGNSNPDFNALINIRAVVNTDSFSTSLFTTDIGAYKRVIEEINDPLYVARQLEASGDSLQAYNIYKNMIIESSDPSMKHFLITSMLRVAPCMENGLNDIRNTINNELASAKSWYKACLDFTLCNLLYREGRYSEALDAFNTKAKEYKGTPIEQEYLINLASMYGEKFGDKNTARTYADMAAAINPGESYLRLAYEAAGIYDYIPASHEYRIIDPFSGYPDSGEPEEELVSASEDVSVSPNPFNPITTISYTTSLPSHVSLTIYNITGQKVATLVNGLTTTGYHSVQFDGSALASGVYFYRFETPKFNKSGKLLLVK